MFTARDTETMSPDSSPQSVFTSKLQQFMQNPASLCQRQVPQPIPVPSNYSYQQPYGSFQRQYQYRQHETWWFIVKSWGRYYFIQTRWDLERALARLLHRRWGQ